jgi:hypothetical protein
MMSFSDLRKVSLEETKDAKRARAADLIITALIINNY